MPDIDLGPHFDAFVRHQLASGRFRSASEVVQAGLRLLEVRQTSCARLRREIAEAFDDPRPSLPASEVFARLRAHHDEEEKADRHGG